MPPPSSLQRAFAEVIQDLRLAAGMSQEDLAAEAGVHRTYISDLERGLKAPGLATIEGLARALRKRPHMLLLEAERRVGLTMTD